MGLMSYGLNLGWGGPIGDYSVSGGPIKGDTTKSRAHMGILLGLWGLQFSIYLKRAIDQSCLESEGSGPQGWIQRLQDQNVGHS